MVIPKDTRWLAEKAAKLKGNETILEILQMIRRKPEEPARKAGPPEAAIASLKWLWSEKDQYPVLNLYQCF